MEMTAAEEEVFILRSLEAGSTALPHRATRRSTKVSQEAEGAGEKHRHKTLVVFL